MSKRGRHVVTTSSQTDREYDFIILDTYWGLIGFWSSLSLGGHGMVYYMVVCDSQSIDVIFSKYLFS